LSGARVVITAGASGIGCVVAEAFLAQDARVAVLSGKTTLKY